MWVVSLKRTIKMRNQSVRIGLRGSQARKKRSRKF